MVCASCYTQSQCVLHMCNTVCITHGYYGITVKPCRVYMFVHLLNVIHGATGRPINPTDGGAKPHPGTAVSQTPLTFLFFFHFQFLEMSGMTKLFSDCSVCIMVEMVGECQTQKPVNFMTRSQLDNLHHGQAVRKAVVGRVFRFTRETYFNLLLAKSLCTEHQYCQLKKKHVAIRHNIQ